MDGILPLWKPKGLTSHDCVIKIRKLFQTKKAGHTGTLDPEAEGMLPICLGEATKIVPYLMDTKKTYIAEVKLGTATDTEDREGKIVEQKEVTEMPSHEKIDLVLGQFRGEIMQIPPMYSAVKVNGKKLYEYARENKTVERPKRKVTIFDIERLERKGSSNHSFWIKVTCSKGTYIRTLCVDIGRKLGYPAHMHALTRIATGGFGQHNCVTFDEINAVQWNERKKFLQPIAKGLDHLDYVAVDEATKNKIVHGQKLPLPEKVPETNPFVMIHDGDVLAIYRIHPEQKKQIKAVRVFNRG